MMQYPPLKRHPALQPLSRDHYVGLVQTQHLHKAAEASPSERRQAVGEFLQAWTTEIAEHFNDEERLLIDLMTAGDAERLRAEHDQLRELASQASSLALTEDPGSDFTRELGGLLERHIRWEERELFPAIERACGPDRLADLERHTAVIEGHRPRSACSRGS